jgi:NTE family protein
MNIGLALGSGSSRGWAHIGIIHALADLGIEPNIICGTSIGSLVGASYVSNKLGKLEKWVCSLTKFELARFFEINTSLNGFVDTERLHHFLNEYVANDDALIEEHPKQFASGKR